MTVSSLLNEAVEKGESLRLEMDKGDVSLNLSYTPERDGNRREIAFSLKG